MTFKLKNYSRELYFTGLSIVAIGLPFSRLIMSIGMIWLAVVWIIEGDYKRKIKAFLNNRVALVLSSVFVLHLFGLFNTKDFGYALNDIRVKLPLLLLPIIFSGMPRLSAKTIKYLMYVFVTAVFISTLFNFLIYLGIIMPDRFSGDARDISYFISHIRLGLMISFSIMILGYLFYKNHTKMKPVHALFAFWFLGYLYVMESFTGFTTLIAGTIILLMIYAVRFKDISLKLLCLVVALAVSGGTFLYVKSCVDDYYTLQEDITDLDEYSPNGEKYFHNMNNNQIENGYYVHKHIAIKELIASWSEVSDYDFEGLDERGQPISSTLIRYLTSKGLRKDKNGVERLTKDDIHNIENGIANVKYVKGGIRKRIHQVLFEIDAYNNHANPTGNSFTQRMEYWKNGWSIAENNLAFGVGTGDVQRAFNQAYVNNKTKLSKEKWNRAHNQYLTFLITFGVLGFLWFLFSLVYPMLKQNKLIDFYFLSFFVIALLSFFWEDTLETQAGVSFFAFFYGLFLLSRNNREFIPEASQISDDNS